MLVLSRKPGEKVLIGDNIELTVLEIKGDKVRLGLVAPSEVAIDRQEVRERRASAVTPPDHAS